MTPLARSARTRLRQVDGAIPTRSASALLGSRASAANSRSNRRSTSSRRGRTMFVGRTPAGGAAVDRRGIRSHYRILFKLLARHARVPPFWRLTASVRRSTEVKVGVPREVKNNEFRVAITPAGVHELVRHGHEVYVEREAGVGSAIRDDDYVTAGARILATADDVWGTADMVLKVKEPIAEEYHRMRKDQVLFTYLHLAADKACTDALLSS